MKVEHLRVRHSGSETVFEAFTEDRETPAAFDQIIEWGLKTFNSVQPRSYGKDRRFTYSNVISTLKGFRQTYWLADRQAAMLFKLRWVE